VLAERLYRGKASGGPNCGLPSLETHLQVRAKCAESSAAASSCANGVARPSRGARGLKRSLERRDDLAWHAGIAWRPRLEPARRNVPLRLQHGPSVERGDLDGGGLPEGERLRQLGQRRAAARLRQVDLEKPTTRGDSPMPRRRAGSRR
jgi:hypothetical protein